MHFFPSYIKLKFNDIYSIFHYLFLFNLNPSIKLHKPKNLLVWLPSGDNKELNNLGKNELFWFRWYLYYKLLQNCTSPVHLVQVQCMLVCVIKMWISKFSAHGITFIRYTHNQFNKRKLLMNWTFFKRSPVLSGHFFFVPKGHDLFKQVWL